MRSPQPIGGGPSISRAFNPVRIEQITARSSTRDSIRKGGIERTVPGLVPPFSGEFRLPVVPFPPGPRNELICDHAAAVPPDCPRKSAGVEPGRNVPFFLPPPERGTYVKNRNWHGHLHDTAMTGDGVILRVAVPTLKALSVFACAMAEKGAVATERP